MLSPAPEPGRPAVRIDAAGFGRIARSSQAVTEATSAHDVQAVCSAFGRTDRTVSVRSSAMTRSRRSHSAKCDIEGMNLFLDHLGSTDWLDLLSQSKPYLTALRWTWKSSRWAWQRYRRPKGATRKAPEPTAQPSHLPPQHHQGNGRFVYAASDEYCTAET